MKVDAKCACGWLLPLAVMPMANKGLEHKYGEDDLVPNAIVALICPQCHEGHSF